MTLINQISGKWIQLIDGKTVRQYDFTNNTTSPGYYVSGSNGFPKGVQSDNYITASATAINTGSCQTIGMALFANTSNCVMEVYNDVAATKVITTLQPSQSSGNIPRSGSANASFWAKALTAPFSGTLLAQLSEW